MKTLLVATGRGGHLIPAMALAEHLRTYGPCRILCTARPAERTMVDSSSIEWTTVDLQRLTPMWRWFLPWYTLRQLKAVLRIWTVMRQMRPQVVVGFGGYLSAVGVAAARVTGLPTVVHEQNLLPGRANRLLARLADAVAVTFSETKQFLPHRAAIEITGNPIRTSFKRVSLEEARSAFGLDLTRPVLLVMGGSQGARAVNTLCVEMWRGRTAEIRQQVQIIHLAGAAQAKEVEKAYQAFGMEARVFDFLHAIHLAMAAATLAVSRAGASSIAEMVSLQLPVLLIPYPYAGGHQRANAQWMQKTGGAVVLEEKGLTAQRLWMQLGSLLWAPERISNMRAALAAQANGSAVERLGSLVRKVAR